MLAYKMLLEQFLHFLRGRGTPQANGVVMNVHPLMALAVYLVGLGHYDFLDELADDFRRQLRQPSYLSGPLDELLQIRVRENIVPYSERDPETGEMENGYEYDEYKFIMDDAIGLATTIKNNIGDWLLTGRTSEVAPNASLYVTARMDAVDEYTAELIEGGIL